MITVKKNVHDAKSSNKGDANWVIFDYTFIIGRKVFMRTALAKELWYQTLQKNGSKLFKIFSIDIEQDKEDEDLKLYSLTFLGLIINIGFI